MNRIFDFREIKMFFLDGFSIPVIRNVIHKYFTVKIHFKKFMRSMLSSVLQKISFISKLSERISTKLKLFIKLTVRAKIRKMVFLNSIIFRKYADRIIGNKIHFKMNSEEYTKSVILGLAK